MKSGTINVPADCEPEEQVQGKEEERESFLLKQQQQGSSILPYCWIAFH